MCVLSSRFSVLGDESHQYYQKQSSNVKRKYPSPNVDDLTGEKQIAKVSFILSDNKLSACCDQLTVGVHRCWFGLEAFVSEKIEIRECRTLEEMAACVDLQREVFGLSEIEISPVRHFVVTKNAGGFALGAFSGERLVGFVLSVPAFLRGQRAFYSHMTAVSADFQSFGIGAKLKWAQRERVLAEGVKYVKWTFEPWKARNAHFNLEKLGAVVGEYRPNFYGTDYSTAASSGERIGLASDRLLAEWHLESEKVVKLAVGDEFVDIRKPARAIEIPADWFGLVDESPAKALAEQARIQKEFEESFEAGLVCRSFVRDEVHPKYLLYED